MNNLGVLLMAKDSFSEAEEVLRRSANGRERLLGKEHPDTLTSLGNLSAALGGLHQYAEAEVLDRRVLEARRRIGKPGDRATLLAGYNLAVNLVNQGKARRALPLAREIAKEAEQYLPEGDSEREDYANLLRIVLEQQKK
jgi:hypothetical protein